MKETERLGRIPAYVFAELERKLAEKKAAGVDVISLGIGDPDTPTFPHIVEAMQRAVAGPEHASVPVQPRPQGVQGGGRGVLPQALRRRARPRDAGDARDRRQGVHLPPQLRVPRRGRRRARGRSRLPGLHGRPAAGRRRAGADAARPGARLRAGPRRDPGRQARARAADVPQLPEQPDRRRRAGRLLRARRSRSRASTTCWSCTTTPTRS